jgi:hypothetical protein
MTETKDCSRIFAEIQKNPSPPKLAAQIMVPVTQLRKTLDDIVKIGYLQTSGEYYFLTTKGALNYNWSALDLNPPKAVKVKQQKTTPKKGPKKGKGKAKAVPKSKNPRWWTMPKSRLAKKNLKYKLMRRYRAKFGKSPPTKGMGRGDAGFIEWVYKKHSELTDELRRTKRTKDKPRAKR